MNIPGNGAVSKDMSVRSKRKPAKEEKTPTLHISDEGENTYHLCSDEGEKIITAVLRVRASLLQ